ncbi:MAG: hypothetical protein K2O18_15925 [Oscillospiraceae bacterium]|nr:hypothetical protein [Oscillospiraceae bacterium]
MGKKIIITSGPTNEQIDAVMKITNMSTGSLGSLIAETFLQERGDLIDKLYYLSPKLARKPAAASDKLELITIESAEDLLETLKKLLTCEHIDIVVHSAAVGDYKAKYTMRAEDLIDELVEKIPAMVVNGGVTKEALMSIFENPEAVCSAETKISSYEPHLMTMMTLTPKVIGSIKELSPDTQLVGCKLLKDVPKLKLYQASSHLRKENRADYIIANDLSNIGGGRHQAMIIGKDGVVKECQTKADIAASLLHLLF